jgi:acetylornithine deacetylase/succinyl-diaminopimelate desuccinylase-like protein
LSRAPAGDLAAVLRAVDACVDRERLLATAIALIEVPSRTGEAGGALDRLAAILESDGFAVDRVPAGHPSAPAVATRLDTGRRGRTLQFDAHLDTVHLPFVPPRIEGELLRGSGSSDMKGGAAAAVEALRAARDAGVLGAGSILLTAHDLHEAPWGRGEQLDRMILDGLHGDAVLIPEPLCDRLPIAGRGCATWKTSFRREGPAVHEVMRPAGAPHVAGAGADFLLRLRDLDARLSARSDPLAGNESVFVGQIHSGEIYNQLPQECWLEGTRRWLPGTPREVAEKELERIVSETAKVWGVQAKLEYRHIRDAYRLDTADPIVTSFRAAYDLTGGAALLDGSKPFVDDGNSFWALAGAAAITHGPRAGGQHTVEEWASIDDLVRVARLYALTAAVYCGEDGGASRT